MDPELRVLPKLWFGMDPELRFFSRDQVRHEPNATMFGMISFVMDPTRLFLGIGFVMDPNLVFFGGISFAMGREAF